MSRSRLPKILRDVVGRSKSVRSAGSDMVLAHRKTVLYYSREIGVAGALVKQNRGSSESTSEPNAPGAVLMADFAHGQIEAPVTKRNRCTYRQKPAASEGGFGDGQVVAQSLGF